MFSEPTVQLSERLPIVETQRADPDLRSVRETHAVRNADEAGIRLCTKVFDAGIRDGAEPRHHLIARRHIWHGSRLAGPEHRAEGLERQRALLPRVVRAEEQHREVGTGLVPAPKSPSRLGRGAVDDQLLE